MSAPPPRIQLLTSARLPLLAALLAVLLTLPSLWGGFVGDDWIHRGMLLRIGLLDLKEPMLTGLFRLLPGGDGNAPMVELGLIPWWANPGVQASFLRPLSIATHMLDYVLWPDQPVLHHLHGLLWFGLGVFLVARLYRRLMLPGAAFPAAGLAAGAAALLFAVEDSHAMPAGWIANRNALVALVFGAACLLLHLRGRQEHRPGLQLGALGVCALALLAGESALGALAYLAAWELFSGPGSRQRRFLALVPYGLLVIAWRLVYNAMGFGAHGSGLYVDPGRQPLAFLEALLERAPILSLGQWLQAPVDAYLFAPPELILVSALLGGLLLSGLGLLFAPLLRAYPSARVLGLGSLLALIPLCAAFPMDRLLLWPGVGASGLLGLLLAEQLPRSAGAGWRQKVALGLLLLHAPLSAGLLLARSSSLRLLEGLFASAARAAPMDEALQDQVLVFLNGNELCVAYTEITRMVEGSGPPPRRLALLASVRLDNEVQVRDDHTLVYTLSSDFLTYPSDNLFRNPDDPFAVGQRIEMPDFVAEVEQITPDGRPERVAFTFHEPLQSEQLRFVAWKDGRLEEVDLPGPGGRLSLPGGMIWPVL